MSQVLDTALAVETVETADSRPVRPQWHALRSGQGLAGVLLVGGIALLGLLAGVIAKYDPLQQIPAANLLGPSGEHWFGTDNVNRDLFARVLHGIRINLFVGFVAVPLGAVLGSLAGLLSSLNSLADVITQRVFDLLLAFPALILAIALAAVTGPGVHTVIIVIVAVEVPLFGRQIRTAILSVREQPYVEAAEVIGAGSWWTLRKHVLPNVLEPLGVQLALSMSLAVFVEAAMSFIGIGVRPPEPSLGGTIADSIAYLDANPAFAVGPLLVVSGLTLGFLLIAQALGRARRIA
ncbi:ABC transporter permease [Nocardia goodfellowii]|uniref:Peptide/nickel transport system permease protein n=1 Tax=Nocardia goodfellowii TaxID=882446 RepID=A0ABS4QKE7_9NOCA|nr:ABC transporter permease [Nocardia goodfellowii]MBP2192181.1 peptide/nickel transport system permease protein [Nocardia goodfellowii]